MLYTTLTKGGHAVANITGSGNYSKSIIDALNSKKNLINLPHKFMDSTDPGARVFSKHMLIDAPLVLIRPGTVDFERAIKFEEDAAKALNPDGPAVSGFDGSGLFSTGFRYGDDNDKAYVEKIQAAIEAKKFRNAEQIDASALNNAVMSKRYFEFSPDVGLYLSVVSTLSARLWAALSSNSSEFPWVGSSQLLSDTNALNGGFFTFWADGSTSVSESASNETGNSMVQESMKKVASVIQGLYGSIGNEGILGGAADSLAANGNSGNLVGNLGSAVRGFLPMFPEIWRDSAFSRDYSLSFKLYSPYGDSESIYNNVLFPFAMLLSLALPIQRSVSAYSSPFIFQMDVPGYFACDMGIVSSFSFVKGGSEQLWTAAGLPRQIDVTMSVKDLYPTMTTSHNMASMSYNVGLMTFLDNLAGVAISKSGERSSIVTQIKTAFSRTESQIFATAPEMVKSEIYESLMKRSVTRAILGIFGE